MSSVLDSKYTIISIEVRYRDMHVANGIISVYVLMLCFTATNHSLASSRLRTVVVASLDILNFSKRTFGILQAHGPIICGVFREGTCEAVLLF